MGGESEDYDGEESLDGAYSDEYYVEHVCYLSIVGRKKCSMFWSCCMCSSEVVVKGYG